MTPSSYHRAARRRRSGRSAYTLTELLIVIMIMIILVVIALPVARKILDDTHTREASRQLQAFFSMAQGRAALTGRPAGLFFQCDPLLGAEPSEINARQVTQMYLAEVPPPYVGSTVNARAGIYRVQPGMPREYHFVPVSGGAPDAAEISYLRSLIQDGELFLVRFAYKGPWYYCKRGGGTPGDPLYPNPDVFYYMETTQALTATPVPPGYSDSTLYRTTQPFQILLPPRRVGSPLELTGGTCIDVAFSGIGPSATFADFPPPPTQSIVVMFKPGGELDSLWYDGAVGGAAVPGSLHFLVGKVEKVGSNGTGFANPELSNLADPNSLWVSVNRMGGGVVTTENVPDPTAAAISPAAYLQSARRVAVSRDQMRGR